MKVVEGKRDGDMDLSISKNGVSSLVAIARDNVDSRDHHAAGSYLLIVKSVQNNTRKNICNPSMNT